MNVEKEMDKDPGDAKEEQMNVEIKINSTFSNIKNYLLFYKKEYE